MPSRQLRAATVLLLGAAAWAGHHVLAAQESNQAKTEQGKKEPINDETIRYLIKQLGDDSYERRESAFKRLAAIGEPALELLEKEARETKDAEIRQRVNVLRSGIVPSKFIFISLMPRANTNLADSFGSGALAGNNLAKLPKEIDFHSTNTLCSPFCVAMSAERPKPEVAWRFKGEPAAREFSGAIVADDVVFVGSLLPNVQGVLRALRTADGKEVWTHEAEGRIYTRPCFDKDHVYYTTETKGITALARKDGQPRWHHAIEHGAGPCVPVASKGLVVVGGCDGFVYALDAKDGAVKWQANIVADAPPDAPGFPGERARLGRSLARPVGVACDGETVYQNLFDQSRVVAIDLATGKLRWSYQTGGWMGGAPAFSSDRVLVGSQDKFVHCLDRRTGRLVWKFETKHRNGSTPVVEGGSVYFGSDNGGVFRVNLADGKQIWKFDTDPDDGGRRFISSAPLLVKDTLYIATGEGQVYALNKETGELRWKLRASENSRITSSIVSDGRRLFVATREDLNKRGEPSLVAISVK